MKLRVVVADDEGLARRELRRLLGKSHPEVEIVGEATDGLEAVAMSSSPRWSSYSMRMRREGFSFKIVVITTVSSYLAGRS